MRRWGWDLPYRWRDLMNETEEPRCPAEGTSYSLNDRRCSKRRFSHSERLLLSVNKQDVTGKPKEIYPSGVVLIGRDIIPSPCFDKR